MNHKAGFVNIIGNPNVGKSTLMNALVGEQLVITTAKAQTTRDRIIGIVNHPDYQIVFSDTPGIIKPAYELQEAMMNFVMEVFQDADLLIYMVAIGDKIPKNEVFLQKIINSKLPVILLINKIDTATQPEVQNEIAYWQQKIPNSSISVISALEKFNLESVFDKIINLLPESPPFYPKDQLTDKPERFFVNEKIREKILKHYQKEIPYSVAVTTQDFISRENSIKIRSTITVERQSQKGIIIGHKGSGIKRVGTEARKDLERFFDKKIFMELIVKVDKNWRSDKNKLKKLGYRM